MTTELPNVTSAEYQELSEWLTTQAKRETTMQRMSAICSRLGSFKGAVEQSEKRLKALRDEEAQVKADIERARGEYRDTKREAEEVKAAAKKQAAELVTKGKADAAALVAKVDGELNAKRAQLAEVSKRLADAQKLLAS
jgi:chromosome segregation ATPase